MAGPIDIPAGGAMFIAVLFIIGLLVGIVAKRAFKLAIAIIALVILLGIAGYISPPSQQTIYNVFSQGGIVNRIEQVTTILPLSSAVFLIGLAIGIWKG
jgi:hypothetical protein